MQEIAKMKDQVMNRAKVISASNFGASKPALAAEDVRPPNVFKSD